MKTGEGFRGDGVKLLNKLGSDPYFEKWVAGSPNTPDHEEQYTSVKQCDVTYPDMSHQVPQS